MSWKSDMAYEIMQLTERKADKYAITGVQTDIYSLIQCLQDTNKKLDLALRLFLMDEAALCECKRAELAKAKAELMAELWPTG